MNAHEIETQMWRWRRRADSLYNSLVIAVQADSDLLFHTEVIEALEDYSNDRFDDPDRWRRNLKKTTSQGATA